ncbi:hypothetical protein MM1218R_01527 [Mycobacterium marinum]|uniref:hypothetical protein n=1 Tax=Mycobacterium marinum TaxID=1781 RepID=UPI000E28AE3A|nr:hypothetical protein [Mycobacterium marinum]AXN43475.1 hypothetical protein MM1218R_01527 [Mycobacterium marinum]RFZ11473.1 hypothetical protein DE4381_01061 [Mycobacterium marinum]
MATATASGTYGWAGTAVAVRPSHASASGTFEWAATAVALSPKTATASGGFDWSLRRATADNGEYIIDPPRWRVIVQEIRSGQIVIPDLTVTNLVHQRALSAPADIQCDVDFHDDSVAGVVFKPWGHLIHIERVMLGKRRVWISAIVQPSEIDEKTGILHLKAKGFSCYPKKTPWLEDINWLANDVFRPVVAIWDHIQHDFPNGDLGVEVFPQTSGVIQLPGYAFDGDLLNLNFFATFIRAQDKLDCGDYIDALARDTPFDYAERSQWNAARTNVVKKIELGYPRLGLIQTNLAFVINENVLSAKPHIETQIDWISDVGVSGWFPGMEASYELANADPDRLRRYLDETDGFIDSNERAASWAHKRLARRQTPAYWEEITVDMNHPNAPFGSYDVGDTITVSGFMPWVGDIALAHKIIAIGIDDTKNICKLTLKAEGAFNYDPIFFPSGVSNIVGNPGFDFNLTGWTASGGGWSHDAGQGANRLGSATVVADGGDHYLITQPFGLSPFQIFPVRASVKCSNAVSSGAAVQVFAQFYDDDLTPTQAFMVGSVSPRGMVPWTRLGGKLIAIPPNTRCALGLYVGAGMTAGQVWFDDAEMVL